GRCAPPYHNVAGKSDEWQDRSAVCLFRIDGRKGRQVQSPSRAQVRSPCRDVKARRASYEWRPRINPLAWPPLNAVLSQSASCPGERIQSVRLVLSFEGDHQKAITAKI